MLPGIILTAGDSARMGTPKALLPDAEGTIFITRIVRTLQRAGLDDLVVVTGRHHEPIAQALAAAEVHPSPRLMRNPEPSRGQLSSLHCGMDAVCGDRTPAVLVTLVDVPMIAVETVRRVVEAWHRTRAPIVRPVFNGRRGHPVVFDCAVFDELRSAHLDRGARVVVRAHHHDSVDVPVDDRGCLVDVDTPGEYEDFIINS